MPMHKCHHEEPKHCFWPAPDSVPGAKVHVHEIERGGDISLIVKILSATRGQVPETFEHGCGPLLEHSASVTSLCCFFDSQHSCKRGLNGTLHICELPAVFAKELCLSGSMFIISARRLMCDTLSDLMRVRRSSGRWPRCADSAS